MEDFIIAYGVNTLASSFDLATTAILHKKTGNPNEMSEFIRKKMTEKGPFKAALEGEATRRIGFLAIGLMCFAGETIYSSITGQTPIPLHLLILYGSAILYGGAGLLNLIPIAFNKGDKTDIF